MKGKRKGDSAVERIAAERQRQLDVEKWTLAHDDQHKNGEIAWAAACYAAPLRFFVEDRRAVGVMFRDPWPWDERCDRRPHPSHGNYPEPEKATKEERIKLLVKAGALIVAEIERLERLK